MKKTILLAFIFAFACSEPPKRPAPIAGKTFTDEERCEQLDSCISHCDNDLCDYYCEEYVEIDELTCQEIMCENMVKACNFGDLDACEEIPFVCDLTEAPKRER